MSAAVGRLSPEDAAALHPCDDPCEQCVDELPEVVEQIVARHESAAVAAFKAEAVAAIEAEAAALTEIGSVLCEFYGINCRHCETPNQAVMQPAGAHLKAVADLIRKLTPP